MLFDPNWRLSFREPAVFSAPIQIWRLHLHDLGDSPLQVLQPVTVPAEHDRARQFRFEDDQLRHLAGRGLLRTVLAYQHERAPRAFSIVEDPNGKPHMEDEGKKLSLPNFNIAHTADTVVVALSQECPVGIDIESWDRVDHPSDLAQRVLTEAELQQWHALPAAERDTFFVHLWTCKEAFLKATGTGLRRAPDTIECSVEGNTVTSIDDAEGYSTASNAPASEWALRPFRVSDDVIGAVVRRPRLPSSLPFVDACRLFDHVSPH